MTEGKTCGLLEDLAENHVSFVPDGFSIDLAADPAQWHRAFSQAGVKQGCRFLAEKLCDTYAKIYGKQFLFSERCVAYEIEFHLDAYMRMLGYRGYIRHVITWFMGREYLVRHCESIDISMDDVARLRQALMFGYRRGIRECYRRTENDPYLRRVTVGKKQIAYRRILIR